MRKSPCLPFMTLGLGTNQLGSPGLGVSEPVPGSNLLSNLCQITFPFRAAGVSSVKLGHWTK